MTTPKNQFVIPLLQGARAVRSGRFGELGLEAGFAAYGAKIVMDNPVYHNKGGELWARSDLILVCQYRMFDGSRLDYVFRDYRRDFVLAIEHKQQMGSGTTDEKLSYAVDRLAKYELPFWLVLSGGGFNPKVTATIEKKVKQLESVRGRVVFNQGHFLQRAIEKLIECGEP
jgi:hypothetical protein